MQRPREVCSFAAHLPLRCALQAQRCRTRVIEHEATLILRLFNYSAELNNHGNLLTIVDTSHGNALPDRLTPPDIGHRANHAVAEVEVAISL
jgi:hypothetical protein